MLPNLVDDLCSPVCHSRSSIESPHLLILDNRDSHLCIDSLQFCKDHVISLPPHYSHHLLDRTVFGSFKRSVNYFSDVWISHEVSVVDKASTGSLSSPILAQEAHENNIFGAIQSIRHFPRALPREQSRLGRKRLTTSILTNANFMNQLKQEQSETRPPKKSNHHIHYMLYTRANHPTL